MGLFHDNEMGNMIFTLLGMYCGLLESMEAEEAGAEGQEESGGHFSL